MKNISNMISIIIPVYNSEATIERAIESVLNQSYKNYEIIIIDDGSNDDTKVKIEKFLKENRNIRYFYKKNEGVSKARNDGIRKSNGKYITFLDSDDIYCENYLSDFAKEVNEKAIITCNYNGNKKNPIRLPKDIDSFEKKDYYEFLDRENLLNSVCNKIYNKEVILENNIEFDQTIINGEDILFNLEYIDKMEKFIYINNINYEYIENNNSITHDLKNREYFKQVKIVNSFIDIYTKNQFNYNELLYKYIYTLRDAIDAKIEMKAKKKKIIEYINKCLEDQRMYNELKKNQISNKDLDTIILKELILRKNSRMIYFYIKIRNKLKGIKRILK